MTRRRSCRPTARRVADVPVGSLGDGPLYHRPAARPDGQDALQADDPAPRLRAKFPMGADLAGELLALLATPTIADKTWVSRQYDHQLFLSTVAGPGADAAVLRVKGTRKALALATDGKARFCHLDPRVGARLVVLEAARNVACTGAQPLALVNCLNFGDPEHAEVMWQFTEVVEGMSEACEALGIPVIGGNVSFYNASSGADIHPTPVVGVLGLIDELDVRAARRLASRAGESIVVLGETRAELGGSEWAAVVHGLDGGAPPVADLDAAVRLHALVVRAGARARGHRRARRERRRARGRAVRDGVRRRHRLPGRPADRARAPGRAPRPRPRSASRRRGSCVAVAAEQVAAVLGAAAAAGRARRGRSGQAGGEQCIADGAFSVPLGRPSAWHDAIPNLMAQTTEN